MNQRTPAPGRNLTPYALGAIGLLVVGGYFRVIPSPLPVLLIVAVVALMSSIRKRENRARFEAELRQWHAQNPNAQRDAWAPPAVSPPPRSGWSNAGVVIAVIAAIGGMAILAAFLVVAFALSTGDFGNK